MMRYLFFAILLVGGLGGLILFSLAEAQGAFVWPTESVTLSSPFGPRLKGSEDYRYDFHRGIDIAGNEGSSIFAIADGTVYRVYEEGNTTYPNSGNLVILKHEEPETFYSLYAHLASMAVVQDQSVTAGQTIGTLGSSGSATYPHLHFEIREGTTCSLESQLEGGSCTYYGYDPHVNPMEYVGTSDTAPPNVTVLSESPLTVHITADRNALDFNEITVRSSSGKERTFNFNTREGFDASSTEALDESLRSGVFIEPAAFSSDTAEYSITFTFQDWTGYASIVAKDLWGNATSLTAPEPIAQPVEDTDYTGTSDSGSDESSAGEGDAGAPAEAADANSEGDSETSSEVGADTSNEPATENGSGTDETTEPEAVSDDLETVEEGSDATVEGVLPTFIDIDHHFAEEAILTLAAQNVVSGYDDNTFRPDASLARAEAAALLDKVLEIDNSAEPLEDPFLDVPKAMWYEFFIGHLKEKGLVEGYSDGTFLPFNPINRAEFLTLALNVRLFLADDALRTEIEALMQGPMTDRYIDLYASAWYAPTVAVATELGWVEGRTCDDGPCFEPSAEINRGEAALMVYRVFYETYAWRPL